MQKTSIDWVKNPDGSPGYSWNPITGCLNGCEYCYARKLANTRLRERYLANKTVAPVYAEGGEIYTKANNMIAIDPFYPRFWPERLSEMPRYIGKQPDTKEKGIFVCDMSDLFGIGIPETWTRAVLDRANYYSWYRFYLLTKQPQNLIKFSPFLPNCYIGVSATNTAQFGLACYWLADVKATVKYISFEPLLGSVAEPAKYIGGLHQALLATGINWVILGAQTKPTVMPEIEWVREIVEACDKAGIPVFLKDNLLPLIPAGIKNIAACDSWLIGKPCGVLRQEMP